MIEGIILGVVLVAIVGIIIVGSKRKPSTNDETGPDDPPRDNDFIP